MAGTGRVQVISKTPVSHNQYDVTISFDIAFDWGGLESRCILYYILQRTIIIRERLIFYIQWWRNWVWGHIGTKDIPYYNAYER